MHDLPLGGVTRRQESATALRSSRRWGAASRPIPSRKPAKSRKIAKSPSAKSSPKAMAASFMAREPKSEALLND